MSEFSGSFIKVSEPIPHVLHIQLDRKPVNAVNEAYWKEYNQTFENIVNSGADVRVVVLSSALPQIFLAGIDFRDATWGPGEDPSRTGFELRGILKEFQHCIGAPSRVPFPVIAAVHGPVIGLGVDMICYCDIRYAASNATFNIKEVDMGLAADIGTLALLGKVTGNESLARELAYTSRAFSSAEAEKLGLVSRVVEGGMQDVVNEALSLARVIASKSPVAVHGSKALISHARDHSVAENLDYTAVWNSLMLQSHDSIAAISAARKKGQPEFVGLRNAKL